MACMCYSVTFSLFDWYGSKNKDHNKTCLIKNIGLCFESHELLHIPWGLQLGGSMYLVKESTNMHFQ